MYGSDIHCYLLTDAQVAVVNEDPCQPWNNPPGSWIHYAIAGGPYATEAECQAHCGGSGSGQPGSGSGQPGSGYPPPGSGSTAGSGSGPGEFPKYYCVRESYYTNPGCTPPAATSTTECIAIMNTDEEIDLVIRDSLGCRRVGELDAVKTEIITGPHSTMEECEVACAGDSGSGSGGSGSGASSARRMLLLSTNAIDPTKWYWIAHEWFYGTDFEGSPVEERTECIRGDQVGSDRYDIDGLSLQQIVIRGPYDTEEQARSAYSVGVVRSNSWCSPP
jgi:hypothetical protein